MEPVQQVNDISEQVLQVIDINGAGTKGKWH